MKIKTLLLCFISLFIFAFGNAEAQYHIGLMGGVNHYRLSGDVPENGIYQSLSGLGFNLIGEYDIAREVRLSIQPGFVQKGVKIAFEVAGRQDPLDSVEVRIDYLTIPLLVKVSTWNERFYVFSGLEFAFPLNALFSTSSGETEIRDQLKSPDISVNFSVGYLFPLKNSSLFLELRYSQSIVTAVKEGTTAMESGLEPRLWNNGFNFFFGYLYHFPTSEEN
jgi:hypothetical protein